MLTPTPRPPVIREVLADGWRVRLDVSGQILRVEIPEHHDEQDSPLLPTLPRSKGQPVSAAMLLLKAKHFDDGLYAAVEVATQDGAGFFPAKAAMLRALATSLTAGAPAEFVHAACELGGVQVETPAELSEGVRKIIEEFLANETASKPLGFYTWSAKLWSIFRQDRLLQRPLPADVADPIARALEASPAAAQTYRAWLTLASRLTNPPDRPGLFDPPDRGGERAFFAPSRSHEVTLFERLFGDSPVPDDFDLMTELIRRVRTRDIDLTPADSGWYDRQTWSLEPLVVPERRPESARLDLGPRYRRHMEDLFRGALALARETHVKQAGGGRGGYGGGMSERRRPVYVHPGLTVEPLPSVYARRAEGYRFVRASLTEAFGAQTMMKLHRLLPGGRVAASLAEELAAMQELFDGAAATAAREIGHEASEINTDRFSAWPWDADEDVGSDARMMVPVFYDMDRKMTKVWALLGWRAVPVNVGYRQYPKVIAIEPQTPPEGQPRVEFASDSYEFAVPVMAEVYVTELLDRDEFRRHCDRHRTRDAILANLR